MPRVDESEARFESLYSLVVRLAAQRTLASTLNEVLVASLDLVGADAAYIRLFAADDAEPGRSAYPFAIQKGISDAYVEYFSSLTQPVDPEARTHVFHGRPVMIDDMSTHPSFLAHREVVLAEGYRSLQSTPLITQNGSRAVGALITYFYDVCTPAAAMSEALGLYAHVAASAIGREQQIAVLSSRESMLGALLEGQSARLQDFQDRTRMIESRASVLDAEGIRLAARALREEIRRARAEIHEAELGESYARADLQLHPYGLSPREIEVMANVWRGLSDKQIAIGLGISRFTVAKHIGSALRKMNVDTRTQASVLFERESLYKIVPEH